MATRARSLRVVAHEMGVKWAYGLAASMGPDLPDRFPGTLAEAESLFIEGGTVEERRQVAREIVREAKDAWAGISDPKRRVKVRDEIDNWALALDVNRYYHECMSTDANEGAKPYCASVAWTVARKAGKHPEYLAENPSSEVAGFVVYRSGRGWHHLALDEAGRELLDEPSGPYPMGSYGSADEATRGAWHYWPSASFLGVES